LRLLSFGIRALLNVGLLVALTTGTIQCVRGQRVASVDRSETITFSAVSDLTKPSGVETALRHARLANPSDWPASFYSVHPGGSCTSTLIGPRALLTAAHCAPERATVVIRMAGKVYKGICSQSDSYLSDPSADWAICLMDIDIPIFRYETVNLDASRIKINTQLLLTGFGCTEATGTGGNDGNYRIGEANVTKLPSGVDNDIQTTGDVALCFGDSGGPAFFFLDAGKKRRVQVSVNSRISPGTNGNLGNTSYLSSLSTNAARTFLQGWAAKNAAEICGVNLSTSASKCQH